MDKSRMVEGPIFKTLLTFSLPLVIINIVQLLLGNKANKARGVRICLNQRKNPVRA